jgi:lipopolysaccharide assembly protein A
MTQVDQIRSGGFGMLKAKLIAALVLIAIAIVVVFQNTQPVETKFLFVTLTMPRAALLAITLMIGVVVGMLVRFVLTGNKHKKDRDP